MSYSKSTFYILYIGCKCHLQWGHFYFIICHMLEKHYCIHIFSIVRSKFRIKIALVCILICEVRTPVWRHQGNKCYWLINCFCHPFVIFQNEIAIWLRAKLLSVCVWIAHFKCIWVYVNESGFRVYLKLNIYIYSEIKRT